MKVGDQWGSALRTEAARMAELEQTAFGAISTADLQAAKEALGLTIPAGTREALAGLAGTLSAVDRAAKEAAGLTFSSEAREALDKLAGTMSAASARIPDSLTQYIATLDDQAAASKLPWGLTAYEEHERATRRASEQMAELLKPIPPLEIPHLPPRAVVLSLPAPAAKRGDDSASLPAAPAARPAQEGSKAGPWPWGTHETKDLRFLAAAAKRFWVNYDPSDPSTAPTNDEVVDWLIKQGVSSRKAEIMASMLRVDGLPTGPRK